MIVSVSEQGGLFLGSAAAGFLLAFVYDILRTIRRIIPHNKFAVHIEDVLFWLLSIVVMFWFLLSANSGEIRFFSIAGAFTGMTAYMILLSPAYMKCSMAAYQYVKKTVLLIISIVVAPVKCVLYFLAFPANYIINKLKGVYNYEKKVYNSVKVKGRHSAKKIRNNIKIVFRKF